MSKAALIIISYYNARPSNQLESLIDQIYSIDAGMQFEILIVVNREVDRNLCLEKHNSNIRTIYRKNEGFNIGAWDYGWKNRDKDYCAYLFLQDDCIVYRHGWLKSLVQAARHGLSGERLIDDALNWDESQKFYEAFYRKRGTKNPDFDSESGFLHTPYSIRKYLESRNIEIHKTMKHLQSLVICAGSKVMEDMGGFETGSTYRDAVASEVAISQKALSLGYRVRQGGLRPFENILHPQWLHVRAEAMLLRKLPRLLISRVLSGATRRSIRNFIFRNNR